MVYWESFDFWRFLAGLGIFLLGMLLIEEALKNLAGRTFKKFLRRHTSHPVKGILSGTVVTGITTKQFGSDAYAAGFCRGRDYDTPQCNRSDFRFKSRNYLYRLDCHFAGIQARD